MKSFLFTAAIFLLIIQKKCMNRSPEAIPACVQQRIDSIKILPPFNPRAEVHEYIYKGNTVYYFSADCCDQYNTVTGSDCNYICAPSGGITGKGDGKCVDFKDAKYSRLVWKDER